MEPVNPIAFLELSYFAKDIVRAAHEVEHEDGVVVNLEVPCAVGVRCRGIMHGAFANGEVRVRIFVFSDNGQRATHFAQDGVRLVEKAQSPNLLE